MDRKASVLWSILTALAVLGGIALCFIGKSQGVLFAMPSGDPQKAVTGFFDALSAGNFDAACALADNYSSLGLDRAPSSREAELMYEALRSSYGYALSGSCVKSGTTARQEVLFRYLDLPSLSAAAAGLSPDFAGSIASLLTSPDAYCASTVIPVEAVYNGSAWLVHIDSSLLAALSGGIGSGEEITA